MSRRIDPVFHAMQRQVLAAGGSLPSTSRAPFAGPKAPPSPHPACACGMHVAERDLAVHRLICLARKEPATPPPVCDCGKAIPIKDWRIHRASCTQVKRREHRK